MRIIRVILFICWICILNGCIPMTDETVTLSFWTDKENSQDGFNMIFANETYVGELDDNLESPICNDPNLINLIIDKSEDLHLTVRNNDGESIDIGIVRLFSVSTGIMIKPTEQGEIYVDQFLDDSCTLVYLNWEN